MLNRLYEYTLRDDPTPAPPIIPTRNALKSVLILFLFFATFLASISALVLKRYSTSAAPGSRASAIFSFISCFGGGVFLATCLMHLLPESMDQIDEAEKAMNWVVKFPFAELCISLGFIFVLFIEQFMIFAHESHWFGSSNPHQLLHDHDHNESSGAHQHGNEETSVEVEEEEHFEHETHSTMRAVILVLAISLHAVFEGLAVGMIMDVSALLQICGALLIHKVIVAISLGVRLVQSNMKQRTVVLCCLIFSGQIVIGGFTGLGIVDVLNKQSRGIANFISGILQAFAAGTFLYITCFEILPHELNKKGYRPMKMLALAAGFALITFFIIIFPDADDGN